MGIPILFLISPQNKVIAAPTSPILATPTLEVGHNLIIIGRMRRLRGSGSAEYRDPSLDRLNPKVFPNRSRGSAQRL